MLVGNKKDLRHMRQVLFQIHTVSNQYINIYTLIELFLYILISYFLFLIFYVYLYRYKQMKQKNFVKQIIYFLLKPLLYSIRMSLRLSQLSCKRSII